jgi:2'-5' RNA ligase
VLRAEGLKLPQNPDEIRSFIAIELPEEVKGELARLRCEMGGAEHSFVKWVAPEGIHLTLKFLGNIPSEAVKDITEAIREASQVASPFRLDILGLGAFPNLRQPRVLWVGIGGEIDRLSSLQQDVDSLLAPLGFAREERPFAPHLTLARIRQGASSSEIKSFSQLVASVNLQTNYSVNVQAVSLMRSQLTPRGAVYTHLAVVELGPRKI